MRRNFAFTLIELLIVVAIIAILASIAVVNMSEAQTRAKVSRSMADMYSIALAIESYAVDYNRYPPNNPIFPYEEDFDEPVNPADYELHHYRSSSILPVSVTTPVAYISSRPDQPFPLRMFHRPLVPSRSYIYFSKPPTTINSNGDEDLRTISNIPIRDRTFAESFGLWVVWGAGPDMIDWIGPDDFHDPNNLADDLAALQDPPLHGDWGYSFHVPYDPTNGTVSFGNIFRTQLSMNKAVLVASNTSAPSGPGDPGPGPAPDPGSNPNPNPDPGDTAPIPGPDGRNDSPRPPAPSIPSRNPPITNRSQGGASNSSGSASDSVGPVFGAPSNQNSHSGGGHRSDRRTVPHSDARPVSAAIPQNIPPAPTITPVEPTPEPEPTSEIELAAVSPADPAPPKRPTPPPMPFPWMDLLALQLMLAGIGLIVLYVYLKRRQALAMAALYYEVDNTNITDGTLKTVPGLFKNSSLDLCGALITNDSAAMLASLQHLETLNLSDTQIGDLTLNLVAGLPLLRTLNLSHTNITDQGIGFLKNNKIIRVLVLNGTQITSASVESLETLRNLQYLDVGDTALRYEDIKPLEKALPNCQIVVGPVVQYTLSPHPYGDHAQASPLIDVSPASSGAATPEK